MPLFVWTLKSPGHSYICLMFILIQLWISRETRQIDLFRYTMFKRMNTRLRGKIVSGTQSKLPWPLFHWALYWFFCIKIYRKLFIRNSTDENYRARSCNRKFPPLLNAWNKSMLLMGHIPWDLSNTLNFYWSKNTLGCLKKYQRFQWSDTRWRNKWIRSTKNSRKQRI